MTIDPMKVWAHMKLKMWEERYWMVHLGPDDGALASEVISEIEPRYTCVIRDQGGFSLVVDEGSWEKISHRAQPRGKFGPFRIVSTDGDLPFDVVGFLRPLLKEFNAHGIKAGPQCGAAFDHLFIYEKDILRAQDLLQDFLARARAQYGVARA